jgi:hypothetical protein
MLSATIAFGNFRRRTLVGSPPVAWCSDADSDNVLVSECETLEEGVMKSDHVVVIVRVGVGGGVMVEVTVSVIEVDSALVSVISSVNDREAVLPVSDAVTDIEADKERETDVEKLTVCETVVDLDTEIEVVCDSVFEVVMLLLCDSVIEIRSVWVSVSVCDWLVVKLNEPEMLSAWEVVMLGVKSETESEFENDTVAEVVIDDVSVVEMEVDTEGEDEIDGVLVTVSDVDSDNVGDSPVSVRACEAVVDQDSVVDSESEKDRVMLEVRVTD